MLAESRESFASSDACYSNVDSLITCGTLCATVSPCYGFSYGADERVCCVADGPESLTDDVDVSGVWSKPQMFP